MSHNGLLQARLARPTVRVTDLSSGYLHDPLMTDASHASFARRIRHRYLLKTGGVTTRAVRLISSTACFDAMSLCVTLLNGRIGCAILVLFARTQTAVAVQTPADADPFKLGAGVLIYGPASDDMLLAAPIFFGASSSVPLCRRRRTS